MNWKGVCQDREGFRKRDSCEHPQGEHSRFPDFKFNPSLEAADRSRCVVFNQEDRKGRRCRGFVSPILILKQTSILQCVAGFEPDWRAWSVVKRKPLASAPAPGGRL